jgi:hypothetical protein
MKSFFVQKSKCNPHWVNNCFGDRLSESSLLGQIKKMKFYTPEARPGDA